MKCYFTYFKLKFISELQYRAAALAGLSTQIFFGLVFIMVYIAFYESGDTNMPMTLSQTITYLWLNQAFFSLINQFYKDKELFNLVTSGNISYELARPKNLYFMWYFKILGARLSMVTLRCIPLLIVAFLLPGVLKMQLPASPLHFLLFIVTLLVGSLLVTAIITLYPIITLKTMNEKGIVNIFVAIADLLSGVVVPIPFFPKFLMIISSLLPFQYISDLPFRIYVGDISISNGLYGLLIQFIWIFITISIGCIILNKSLKRVVVQGG